MQGRSLTHPNCRFDDPHAVVFEEQTVMFGIGCYSVELAG